MRSFRDHLGAYARRNHLAIVALMVAVAGVPTAWALARNSVGPRQLKPGAVHRSDLRDSAVTSRKVANGSLLGADFAAGQLPRGPEGPPGPKGEPGSPGSPGQDATSLFAYVRDPGTGANDNALIQYGKGATAVVEPQPASDDGVYDVSFDRSVTNCVAQATAGMGDPQGPAALPGGGWTTFTGLAADPGNVANTLRVVTALPGFGDRDASFQVSVFC